MSLEDDALDALGRALSGKPVDRQAADLRDCFRRMRELDDRVSRVSPLVLTEPTWAYLGLLGRLYKLTLAFVTQASQTNHVAMQVLARSIVETFCSAAWVCDNPARLVSLVQQQGIKVGGLLNAGYARLPGLKEQYESLSEFAHPHRSSHLLGFRDAQDRQDKGPFSPFSIDSAHPTILRSIDVVVVTVRETIVLLDEVATSHAGTLSSGREMVRVVPKVSEERQPE